MLTITRGRITAAVATAAISLACAASASAAPPPQQEGLVNVNIQDVNVPIGIAANICDVNVVALAQDKFNDAGTCDALADPTAGGDGGPPQARQEGLVNVNVQSVDIPVAVAANVCDVNVVLLASGSFDDAGRCVAIADANA